MKCSKCNSENKNGAKFCANCGAELVSSKNQIPNNNISLKNNKRNNNKKKVKIAVSCVCAALILGVASFFIYESKYIGTISYDNGSTFLDKKAVITGTENSNSRIADYQDGKITLEKKDSIKSSNDITFNEDVGNLRVGSIICAGVTEKTPNGLLREVKSIAPNDDGTLSIATGEAALTDAIKQCDVYANASISPDGGVLPATTQHGPSTISSLFSEAAYADAESSSKLKISLEAKIECSVGMDIQTHLSINWGKVDFEVVCNPIASLDMSASANLKWTANKTLPSIDIGKIVFTVGPVPVVLVNKLTPSIGASLSLTESVSFNFDMAFGRRVGFNYKTDQGVSVINEDLSRNPEIKIDPQANFAIEASVTPTLTLSCKLYDLAGGEIAVGCKNAANLSLKVLGPTEIKDGAITVPGSSTPWKGYVQYKLSLPISGSFVVGGGPLNIIDRSGNAEKKWELFNTGDAITIINLEKYFPDSEKPSNSLDENFGEDTGETEKRELIGGDFIG